jgi:hypothetical protein
LIMADQLGQQEKEELLGAVNVMDQENLRR